MPTKEKNKSKKVKDEKNVQEVDNKQDVEESTNTENITEKVENDSNTNKEENNKNNKSKKKKNNKKESRVEKETKKLENEIEELKEESKELSDSEREALKEEMSKFATQRITSIKDELQKTNERKWVIEKNSVQIEEEKNIVIDENEEIPEVDNEDEEENEEENHEGKKGKKKRGILFKIFTFFLILGIIGISIVAFLFYGPYDGFRDWYITSAMTTMNHQWLATIFFSQERIDEVLSRNKINEKEGVTDTSLIKPVEEVKEPVYANEYERQVLERDPNHPDYKIIDIEGKGYNGYLAVVYDASKIHTMVTSDLYVKGEFVTDMAEREGAVLAINGGGFDDPNYSSNGGTPTGLTISRGEILTDRGNAGAVGGLIGFTEDNVLVIGKISSEEAEEMGVRDGVTCGPFLILNGESSEILGNGGWGEAARTVIAQRADGVVLMLVLNGRNYTTGIVGADMNDLIEIMERYGAYNAACLDGGTSSVIVENCEILNDPIDGRGRHQTRLIPTAFGVFLDEN